MNIKSKSFFKLSLIMLCIITLGMFFQPQLVEYGKPRQSRHL